MAKNVCLTRVENLLRKSSNKAVKKEEIGGVVGIPALGDMVRNR